MIRRVLDTFWRGHAFPFREVIADRDASFERARMLVSISYVVWVVYSLALLRLVPSWKDAPPNLLWQVEWLKHVPWQPALQLIFGAGALFCLLAALCPGSRMLRLLAFLAVFEGQGIRYSYGKIDHASHTWVLALFLLIFLPRLSRRASTSEKHSFLEIIWGVQVVALACYTVAGIQKLLGAWDNRGDGPTVFSVNALGYQIANLTNGGSANGVLSSAFLERPWLGHPLMLGALFLELTALAVAWRPRLHGLWAAGVIAMHIGIGLTMNIWFDPMILMVGIWFLMSPFATRSFCFRATLRDVPWLGPGCAAVLARFCKPCAGARTILFYDGDCGMCNYVVNLLLRIGVPGHVIFASQQGETWSKLLAEKPVLAGMDTIVVLNEFGESRELRVRSEAVLWTLAQLRLPWALLAVFMIVPMPLLDVGYRVIAANRKRLGWLFGRNTCVIPTPEQLAKFLD